MHLSFPRCVCEEIRKNPPLSCFHFRCFESRTGPPCWLFARDQQKQSIFPQRSLGSESRVDGSWPCLFLAHQQQPLEWTAFYIYEIFLLSFTSSARKINKFGHSEPSPRHGTPPGEAGPRSDALNLAADGSIFLNFNGNFPKWREEKKKLLKITHTSTDLLLRTLTTDGLTSERAEQQDDECEEEEKRQKFWRSDSGARVSKSSVQICGWGPKKRI